MSSGDLQSQLDDVSSLTVTGRVVSARGTVIRGRIPGVAIGQLARIDTLRGPLAAEVVGFDDEIAVLMPLGELTGVAAGARLTVESRLRTITVGNALLGRVIDTLGRPLDGGPEIQGDSVPVNAGSPDALTRRPVTRVLQTGIRVIDGLLTLGYGQRVGVFAPPGAGKSRLLTKLATTPGFDVVVIGLVGERGREVQELVARLDQVSGVRNRSVVVVATSDAPAQLRASSAQVATAVAEYFRDQAGLNVLLCVDSLTRVARAIREVGLAAGEPPVRQGYPPSLFAELPKLIERAGNSAQGTLTAVYSVLHEGSSHHDPLSAELRGLLDGHIELSASLAARGFFPAIDVLSSLSRSMASLVSPRHLASARRLRAILDAWQQKRDLIALGGYKEGSDALVDEALEIQDDLQSWLRQTDADYSTLDETVVALADLADA